MSETEEFIPPDLSDYMNQLENDITSLNQQIKQGNAAVTQQQMLSPGQESRFNLAEQVKSGDILNELTNQYQTLSSQGSNLIEPPKTLQNRLLESIS